jgi:hypothetical protein
MRYADRSGTFEFEEMERGTWKWCHNWEGNGRGEAEESIERGEVRQERAEKGER